MFIHINHLFIHYLPIIHESSMCLSNDYVPTIHLSSIISLSTYQSSVINLHLFIIYMSLNHPGIYHSSTNSHLHSSIIYQFIQCLSIHTSTHLSMHLSLTCLFIYHLSIDLSIISSFTCHLFINPFVTYSFLTHLPSHPSLIYYISILLSSIIYQLFIH